MRVTISGCAGSGKSTLSKRIAKKFGLTLYTVGALKRQEARKKGMTLAEYAKWANANPKYGHTHFDSKIRSIGRKEDNFVFEARLAPHFIPHSIKILLFVSHAEAARRVFYDSRRFGEKCSSLRAQMQSVKNRTLSDQKYFLQLYKFDFLDPANYDILLDTSDMNASQVAKTVTTLLKLMQKGSKSKSKSKI